MRANKHILHQFTLQQKLFVIFLILLSLPNLLLAYTEHVSLLTRLCNIIFPIGIYWVLLTIAKKPGKVMLASFILIFFAAFQIVLIYLFNGSVIAVDMFLNLTTTNASEVQELLLNLVPAIFLVVILYGGGLVLSGISIKSKNTLSTPFRHKHRIAGTILTFIGFILITINTMINPKFHIHTDIYPFNAFYNLNLAVDRSVKISNYHKNVEGFSFGIKPQKNDDNDKVIVLIIGETSRAANFEIYGYNRETTPHLCSLQKHGNLFAFDNVLTQSNTTHKSVPLILCDLDAQNCDNIYCRKSIITAFKEAGYTTYFFSNQRRNHSIIDFFSQEADYAKFITDSIQNNKDLVDSDLIGVFDEVVNDTINHHKFIVLHTYGSHFAYHKRYPREFAKFVPDNAPEAESKYREELINAYDNTICFVDYFLNNIVEKLENRGFEASILYTSDHGEDIYDDSRERFLHASPFPTIYQLWVPFIVWVSNEYKQNHNDEIENLQRNIHNPVSSNQSVFHTLLSIADIDDDIINSKLSLTSNQYQCDKRYYVNDHNEAVPLNEIITDPLDYEMMALNGISL